MRPTLLALPLLISLSANAADNYWIPAEEFDEYTNAQVQGSLIVDDNTGKQVQLLANNQQVRIEMGFDENLDDYIDDHPTFQVCAYMANYDSSVTNTVESMHFNGAANRQSDLYSTGLIVRCSRQNTLDERDIQIAGLKVVSPSQGTVKVRGVFLRSTEESLSSSDEQSTASTGLLNYEYSRALGYLWGDGGVTTDGNNRLFFSKRNTSTSNHFGSVAESYFGNGLISAGSRYNVRLSGISSANFLADGLPLSQIPDKRAFFTSVIETEGGVLVGRLADDPNLERCAYLKRLVDDLNPRCSANTCTDASCSVPNCAFIATGNSRGTPYQSGRNCGVYLSGNTSDWRSLFSGDDYHFVKTDRTPGGEPTKHDPESRPSYTR